MRHRAHPARGVEGIVLECADLSALWKAATSRRTPNIHATLDSDTITDAINYKHG